MFVQNVATFSTQFCRSETERFFKINEKYLMCLKIWDGYKFINRINTPHQKLSMEIEETLAAQFQQQKPQQQSFFNPQNSNNKSSHSFETQITATTEERNPKNIQTSHLSHKKPKKDNLQDLNSSSQQLKSSQHSYSFSHAPRLQPKANFKKIDRIDENQENPNKGYIDLTLKLQSAYNKITSKNEKSNNKNGQEIINRFKKQEERKKKEITQKKQNAQQVKVKDLQDKPTINQYSQKLAKEIGHKPIHLRLQELMAQKKKKIEENEQLKKKQQEEQEQLFLQEYNKHAKKPENLRSYDDYFNEMVRWKEKKAKTNQEKLQNKKSKELQGITFTPLLNQKSLKMVSSHQRLPIEQRALMKKKESGESRKQKTKNQLNEK